MQELAQANKSLVSTRKNVSCSNGILTQNLSVTLPVLSTLNEKECKPFWNQQCSDIQSTLWLPQKTDLQGLVSSLSNGLLNYQVDESKSWMTRITPLNRSTLLNLSVLLPRSAIATTENDLLKGGKVIASKKIRFYPENEAAYFQALSLYRRSYNLAVERFLNNDYKDENGKWINMRPAIKAQVKEEQKESGRIYDSIISDNGTLAAATTMRAVCSKNKKLKGAKSGFSEIGFNNLA